MLADALHVVSQIIDGIGGLPGLIATLMSGLTSLSGFSTELRSVADSILTIKDALTGVQQARNETLQLDAFMQTTGANLAVYNGEEYGRLLNIIQERQEAIGEKNYARATELYAEASRIVQRGNEQLVISQEIERLEEKREQILERQEQLEQKIANTKAEQAALEKQMASGA